MLLLMLERTPLVLRQEGERAKKEKRVQVNISDDPETRNEREKAKDGERITSKEEGCTLLEGRCE